MEPVKSFQTLNCSVFTTLPEVFTLQSKCRSGLSSVQCFTARTTEPILVKFGVRLYFRKSWDFFPLFDNMWYRHKIKITTFVYLKIGWKDFD